MARKNISINLVGENVSFIDRFIAWALSVGRIVVILTEVIALSAFLYRFTLDRELIDLHEKIKQEQSVVLFLKDNEDAFRNLQNRINLAGTFGDSSTSKVLLLSDILSFAPANITFNTISVQEDRIRVTFNTNSVSSLSEYVKKLKAYDKIGSVIVEKIENKPSSATIIVSITGVLKNAKTQQ